MRNYFLFIFFTVASLHSQDLPFSVDSDTTYWLQHNAKIENKFGLNSIQYKKGLTFRLSTAGSVIEINDYEKKLSGEMTFYVSEYDKTRTDSRIFKKSYVIDSSSVSELFDLIKKFEIHSIPSDRKIPGWQFGNDGITYFFESKNETHASFKSYWTPSAQDIDEATKVNKFIEAFNGIAGLEKVNQEFRKEIPFSSYTYNGWQVVIRAMTREEFKEYEKRKRKLRRNAN